MSRLPFDVTCAAELAAIRAEPDGDSEQVTQALRGEPLALEERRGGWVRVRTAYGYRGWVRAEALSGDVLAEARLYLGAPYEWGGLTEGGIDCSGLVHMAFRRAGRLVPRDAWQQEAAGEPVDVPSPGDLITYGNSERADHIAFWVGGGRILHASGAASCVVEEPEPEQLRGRRRRFVRLHH
jgi:cell wall-associated NlpC family hydrolase